MDKEPSGENTRPTDGNRPLGIEDVRAAIEELVAMDVPITRRSVRDQIGRGSMTKIHSLMKQVETAAEALPEPALSEDLSLIGQEIIGSIFRICLQEIRKTTDQREQIYKTQVAEANKRAEEVTGDADEATERADRLVKEAELAVRRAEEAARQSAIEAQAARAIAETANVEALRLQAVMEQLREDRDKAITAGAAAEEALATAEARLQADFEVRQGLSASLTVANNIIDQMRGDAQAVAKTHAEDMLSTAKAHAAEILAARNELATVHAKLIETQGTRDRNGHDLEEARKTISALTSEVATTRADLAATRDALHLITRERDHLAVSLNDARANWENISTILASVEANTKALSVKINAA